MANTRFGNFSELSQGKEPMTAEEAWIMLNELGLLGQEFIPGATSVRKLMEGKPREAVEELQDWIPGNAAYQNFIRGKEQDWLRNALDAMIIAKPVARGAKKTMEAIEKMPKGGKEGFVQAVFLPKQGNKAILVKPQNQEELKQFNKAIDLAAEKGQIPKNDAIKMKINAASDLKEQQYIQRGLNMGVINADVAPQNLNKIKMEDIDPRYLKDYKLAEAVGNKYKVTEKPKATTKAGSTYYTTGEGGNQLLYSEHTNDAANARHILTDYDMKYKDAVEDLKRALPDPHNPNRYKLIYDKEGRPVNPYKLIVEPNMLEKRMPFRTQEASSKSLNEGKRELEQNPRYMSPDDFLKYMLGLEP